ncbi:response regulator [Nautilia sp.]
MKTVTLDDSETFLSYFKKTLAKMGFEENRFFKTEKEFISFCKKNKDIDIVFIDYHLKNSDGFEVLEQIKDLLSDTYKIMITSDSDPGLKEKALKKGFDSFIEKNINAVDLQALLNTIKTLRKYIKKECEQKEKFKKILKYKQFEEKIIHQKQNKIMKNELEMFFEDKTLFETYFSPKDLLTGDTIHTKKLSDDSYFLSIIDAMGKGISASLTSFNALAFLKHSIKKAVEYNDFNFEKLVEDFVDYVQTILLQNEILCATLVYIKKDSLYYANFGNPPILTDSGILTANNLPIRAHTDKIEITKTKREDKILISSDGIFESKYKKSIYFKRLKEIFRSVTFLKEFLDDFNKNSHQNDDMCMILINREESGFQTVFEEKFPLKQQNIDRFLQKLYVKNIARIQTIHFILHEILTNTYEHSVLKIKNKEKLKEKGNFPKEKDTNFFFFAKIKISKNDKWVKIEYFDNTKGFNVQTIKDAYYKKYHGRGIKIIKHLSYGLFFNENGTAIKIFLKV